MNEEELRKEFEREYPQVTRRTEDGKYSSWITRMQWATWMRSAQLADRRAREECAEICRDARDWNPDSGHDDGCLDSAEAIRATIKQ